MLRRVSSLLVASAAVAGFTASAYAQGYTTRIETRPFYGAVVTLEKGVRVYRALPPERQVIINPDGTPLSLGFNDTHVYEQSSSRNYNYNYGSAGGFYPNGIYAAPFGGHGRGFRRGGNFGPGFHHFGRGRVGGIQVR